VTAVVLLVFVAQLLVNAIHEFYEFGVFPTNPEMMGLVGPIVRHNLLFILAILSIPALMLIIPGRQKAAFVQNTRQRRLQLSAGLVTLSIVFFLGFDDVFSTRTTPNITDVEAVTIQDGIIRIPIEREFRMVRFTVMYGPMGPDSRSGFSCSALDSGRMRLRLTPAEHVTIMAGTIYSRETWFALNAMRRIRSLSCGLRSSEILLTKI